MSFQDLLPSRVGEVRVPPPRKSITIVSKKSNNLDHPETRFMSRIKHGRVSSDTQLLVSQKSLSPTPLSPLSPSHSLTKRRSGGGRSFVLHGKVHNYVTEEESNSDDSLEVFLSSPTTTSSSGNRNNAGNKHNKAHDKSSSRYSPQEVKIQRSNSDTRHHSNEHQHHKHKHHHDYRLGQRSSPSSSSHSNQNSYNNKSTFSQLSREMMHFQKLVSDLESMLDRSGETAEATWRCRILIRSAQEADNDLWRKLHQFESRLLIDAATAAAAAKYGRGGQDPAITERAHATAQSACDKLHRDFKRIHQALLAALSTYEKQQNAEISRLGAVDWSKYQQEKQKKPKKHKNDITEDGPIGVENLTMNQPVQQVEEDYFDRVLRQDELEKMSQSMRTVNDIYKELASLVDSQQPQIDKVQENIGESKQYVQDALLGGCGFIPNQFHRGGTEGLCGSLERFGDPKEWDFPFEALDLVFKDDPSIGEGENVEINADDEAIEVERVVELKSETTKEEESGCEMTCGTIKVDLMTLHRDIIQFSKHVMYDGNKLQCGAVPIRE